MSVIVAKTKELNQKLSLFGYLALLLCSFLAIKSFFSIFSLAVCVLGLWCWRSINRFSYAFWSMIFLYSIFYVGCLGDINADSMQISLMICILVIFLWLGVSFYNPIFYPIVNWFEYDFRYRHDLPFFLCLDHGCYESRLLDFRSGAGSFHSFEELEISETVKMVYKLNGERVLLVGKLLSIRQNTLGRGFYYGVQFDNSSELKTLDSYWRAQKTRIKKLKKIKNEK